MSYCRLGDGSDFYIYDSVYGGTEIHLAARRRVYDVPVPPVPCLPSEDLMKWYQWQQAKMELPSHFVEIDLPHAGESFHFATHEDVITQVTYLVGLGYLLPEGVIEALKETEDNVREENDRFI